MDDSQLLPSRYYALAVAVMIGVIAGAASLVEPRWLLVAVPAGALCAVGFYDLAQTRHSIRRNYPILAHFRFFFETIRPEIRQYLVESDTDAVPFSRTQRSLVYQRAKNVEDKRPFGTELDVAVAGYEPINHSMRPAKIAATHFRVTIGGNDCSQPYASSLLNISAMSFGSLSANAIRALNRGAKLGGFAHDTGEGSISRYHRENGGDLIWELGSGYFGCRNDDGSFSADRFAAQAVSPQVKMIEIKLSQGAKPGHGGVLPAAKVTPEIAAARGVPLGVDCISPARHSAFSTPIELMNFIAKLRELSGHKPVGFKLCIGHAWEFMAICKAMVETGIAPDFVVIDGSEGGTGAAPLEFVDHVGTPLREGLVLAHNCLVGTGLRQSVRLGASGRVVTAFDMARLLALGADCCNAARGFMFALGCIQAQACHTDRCPTGVSTQNAWRQRALVVEDKTARVHRFHQSTLAALGELASAAGLAHPNHLRPMHILKRVSPREVRSFAEVYAFLEYRELLSGTARAQYSQHWGLADARSFAPLPVQVRPAA